MLGKVYLGRVYLGEVRLGGKPLGGKPLGGKPLGGEPLDEKLDEAVCGSVVAIMADAQLRLWKTAAE